MFDYLQKYNQLPKDIRDKISSPQVMSVISELENKYGIELAAIIMKVMIKEIDINKLDIFFIEEHGLSKQEADNLSNDLKNKIFVEVSQYLGIAEEKKIELGEKPKFGVQSMGREETLEKREDFLFRPEDEEEIKRLSQKVEEFSKSGLTDENYEQKINEIIKKAEIKIVSGALLQRFKEILKTYLKGIRDRIETKQAFLKPYEGGGLSFDEEIANKVLRVAEEVLRDKKIAAPKAPPKIKVQEDIQSPRKSAASQKDVSIRDLDYDLTQLKKPVRKKEFKKPKTEMQEKRKKVLPQDIIELDLEHELAPPPPQIQPERNVAKKEKETKKTRKEEVKISRPEEQKKQTKETVKIEPEKQESKADTIEKLAAPKKPSAKFRKPSEAGGKRRMDDVKYVPRVMTPIDELRYMNLVNFRRLADTPQEAIEKIIGKINLLEQEKYSKRVEGIRAWRQSPVNRLYLKLGQLSINERRPIGEIINRIKNKGEDYLTEEEFEAIMDLNKKIRY